MNSAAVTWAELSLVIGGLVACGGGVAGALGFLWTKFNAQDQKIADMRLENARTYVTTDTLIKVEERLSQAIDRLGEKLERAFDRR